MLAFCHMAPKHDVAISFLSADEPIAAALFRALSEGLNVFFYPRSQEDLAGTDGMETMRAPFFEDSRVVVVLYREPWGETPWTRVEQTAIAEGCLRDGWQRLFFIMLEKARLPPKWVPTTHVRFNFADYGLDQAIGAIKARVQEAGGTISEPTPAKRAEQSRRETEYVVERAHLQSPFGREMAYQALRELFTEISEISAVISANGSVTIQFASDVRQCHLRNRVSLLVTATQFAEPKLVVRQYSKRFSMGSENLHYVANEGPQLVSETTFVPDLNRAREYGWSEEGHQSTFLSSTALANRIVNQFIDLTARFERGELG